MLLVGDWTRLVVIAGACLAAVAATIAEAARSVAGVRMRVPAERLRAGMGAPLTVVADFAVLTRVLITSLARKDVVRGRYVVRELAGGPWKAPRGAARQAWTVLLAGYSPNAYVVDVDADRNVVLLHDLVLSLRSEEPA
jgi:hypothetical protein